VKAPELWFLVPGDGSRLSSFGHSRYQPDVFIPEVMLCRRVEKGVFFWSGLVVACCCVFILCRLDVSFEVNIPPAMMI
jgi:hypothetical protein